VDALTKRHETASSSRSLGAHFGLRINVPVDAALMAKDAALRGLASLGGEP
jgi:hypothetical protein